MEHLFSVVVPVYNRPEEMAELLESLANQTDKGFEVMVMEGRCEKSCLLIVEQYRNSLDITYIVNDEGRSARRNEGMQKAKGDYFVLFDSDCIIPNNYFEQLRQSLENEWVDCYGGPDAAREDFSVIQRAVNYSMTSFFTTGGIRGGMKKRDKYLPRAFNMGFSRAVFEATGGYKEMIGEDTDLSMTIKEQGFKVRLIKELWVYHKRRLTLKTFFKQVNTFGKARVLLSASHKGSLKVIHLLPTAFLLGHIALILTALCTLCWWLLLPIPCFMVLVFCESLLKNRSLKIAFLSILTSYIQLFGYGLGYLDELFTKRASKLAAEKLYRQ